MSSSNLPGPPSPRLPRLLRWASWTLVFLVCLELAARIDDRLTFGAPFFGRYESEMLREVDADGIPRNAPGARFEKWRINSLGFRGEEVAREKAPGRRRIICLGQSESFGLYESEGGDWPSRLSRLLEPSQPQAEVINASVVGTSRWSRVQYLEKYLLPLQPDVVILYFNVLNEASSGLRGPPDPSRAPRPGPQSDRWASLRPRSLAKLKLRLAQALPQSLLFAVRTRALKRSLRAIEQSELQGRAPLDALPPENVAAYEAHLRQIVQLLRDKGIQPVLATYPTLAREDNKAQHAFLLSAERTWHIDFSEEGLLDAARRINDATRRVAREMGAPLADVDAAVPRTPEYFYDQVHYTDRGAEVVARHMLQALQQAGLAAAQALP